MTLARRDHPATAAQKVYDADESAYLAEVDRFRSRTGVLYPTATELLRCARNVGYVRVLPESRDHPPPCAPLRIVRGPAPRVVIRARSH